ncbi:Cutinase transcription factor 1 alpha [Penicillium cinerascens]|uniref:Cutinase transcription factor 1 alpha n=1 Tax=Penicillium cinerascens TaxID=70096 RepID=A0A9W9MNJ2_9EURO|nr:Cutinase transcription factor 1 alpha [Penicillium cinerascens]KAJ5204614.1 Cutinase transcription factor 1 alpha [Penicillium cinerascens]
MTPQRKRARQACHFCNSKRIKCNVIDHNPCDNCVEAQKPCQIRESRRGKYDRRRIGSVADQASRQRSSDPATAESVKQKNNFVPSHLFSLQSESNSQRPLTVQLEHAPDDARGEVPEPGRPAIKDSDRGEEDSVFLGESTFVRYMQDGGSPTHSRSSPSDNGRLLHPVLKFPEIENAITPWEASHRRSKAALLEQEGVTLFPDARIVETLFRAYFRWFHPCFAIVDEPDVWHQYQQRKLSRLLLQSLLFVGSTFCDESELHKAGLENRRQATYLFYNNAKDLYDAEYETNKITIIQSLFLLSFRRAGATLEKDARHWLGAAITLAETKALHRSAGSRVSKRQRLRKRLWWSIYVRERQCAAALGLPNRVRDEDCDAETPTEDDFEEAFSPSVSKEIMRQYTLYSIGMTTLSRIIGRIVHCGYLPNKVLSTSIRESIKNELFEWKQRLPVAMQLDSTFGKQSSLHANMLHLAYNNLLILLFRSDFIEGKEDSLEGQIALQAAASNAHAVEDILSSPGNFRFAQIHVITNLFNSLCIHTLRLRRLLELPEEPRRAIAEHQARICLLGLRELQKTWGVKNWVLELFFSYLDESTASRLQVNDIGAGGRSVGTDREPPNTDQQPETGVQQSSNGLAEIGPNSIGLQPADEDPIPNYPWSWSMEEINNFLHTQIESGFAFGEGNIMNLDLEQSPSDCLGVDATDTEMWLMENGIP